MAMIDLQNVDVSFDTASGKVHAVRDVSLSIAKGEIFGVIGYSGAGKSTLVRTINMLQAPTSGTVRVSDYEMTALNDSDLRKARKNIGMIFQHFNLMNARTIAGNVAFPLQDSGLSKEEIREKVDRLLELVNLSDRRDAYPSQLSGGQKQRVAIARALANDPDVLLCDEATSALDPKTTRSILQLLKTVNEQLGVTIVIITHEMSVIKEICDRVAVMQDGYVMEEGSIFDIFSNPQTELTRNFIESASPTEKGIASVLANSQLVDVNSSDRIIRIDFAGADTGDPLVARLARDFGVLPSILYANIEVLQGIPTGTMLVSISGDDQAMADAVKFIDDNGVKWREYQVEGNGGVE